MTDSEYHLNQCNLSDDDRESSSSSSNDDSSDESDYINESDALWPKLDIPGTWGTYGLESEPWNDNLKPLAKFNTYKDLHDLTDEETSGTLTDRIIAAGSSYLDRCPETGKYVICKCTLSGKNLRNISIIKYHHYMQFLNLADNSIQDLTPLGQLPFLMYLDVSKNGLTELLQFKAPFNLTYVNYSHNKIASIPDLSAFWSLVNLNLSYNNIATIEGLENLRFLRYLDLSWNQIEVIENLKNMRLLRLNLEHNSIKRTKMKFNTLYDIVHVNLSANKLKSLMVFGETTNIQSINVACNRINSFMELLYLFGMAKLTHLDLRENPITHLTGYLEAVLVCAKALLVLDNAYVECREKVAAKEKFLPNLDIIAATCHANLLLMEQLSYPLIKTPMMLSEKSPIPIVVLVGPPASEKRRLMKIASERISWIQCGVNHTTRSKLVDEHDGIDYHYVSSDAFKALAKEGEFLAATQILGNYYGLSQQEVYNGTKNKKLLLLHMDITGAMTLRVRGLQPKLVLAMPKTPQVHMTYLKNKYSANVVKVDIPNEAASSLYRSSDQSLGSHTDHDDSQTVTICKEILNEIVDKINVDEDSQSTKSIYSNAGGSILTKESISLGGTSSNSKFSLSRHSRTNISDTKRKTSILKDTSYDCKDLKGTKLSVTFSDNQNVDASETKSQASTTLLSGSTSTDDSVTAFEIIRTPSTEPSSLVAIAEEEVGQHKEDFQAEDDPFSDIIAKDSIHLFHNITLQSRVSYLEVHQTDPGLFSDTIFTDEIDESIKKLEKLFKECIRMRQKSSDKKTEHQIKHQLKRDVAYERIVGARLKEVEKMLNHNHIK